MNMAKKLQVFVSSTFADLRDERQAVVEAILKAGHIPAGMELFAAGDKSQLEIIKRWIQESDVFMLILGGRYGTIEPESKKSYIHVEYEYAASLENKPHFAAIMDEKYLDEKIKTYGKSVIEDTNPLLLRAFKEQVKSKICRFFKSAEELRSIVFESLLDIERNRQLVGWVRANELSGPAPLIEENKQLRASNSQLQNELIEVKEQLPSEETYNGYDFPEVIKRLEHSQVQISKEYKETLNITITMVSRLNLFWEFRKELSFGEPATSPLGTWLSKNVLPELALYGLVNRREGNAQITGLGHSLIRQMERNGKDRGMFHLRVGI